MTTATLPMNTPRRSFASALVTTGFTVALIDGLFASATGLFIPPYATPFRVFRGVASVPFGKEMLTGGTSAALAGILMHICVAFFWSGLFILALRNSSALRAAIKPWPGAIAVAAVYGVSIWLIMTWIVIASMVHQPPNISLKYWVQLAGHIPLVALPMILVNRNRT